ncbi:MAG: hypothetical protein PHZ26_01870 [Candidatus Gracilibacteria bacterium]|nr:hypothetical protein [Candidatus Gracilibacteria bacterium]MDD2908482.1 hypothetical protein [Candidatus Gracilibacteria bacterium]
MKKIITHKLESLALVFLLFTSSTIIPLTQARYGEMSDSKEESQEIERTITVVNSGSVSGSNTLKLNKYTENQIKNQVENQKLRLEARIQKLEENKRNLEAKLKQRQEVVSQIKNNFELKKQEIIKEVKIGKIKLEDAKKQILEQRDNFITKTKADFKNQDTQIKQEKINSLKKIIKNQFDLKLNTINKLSTADQKAKYTKILQTIDEQLKNGNTEKNEILKLIKEVIMEKINSLN